MKFTRPRKSLFKIKPNNQLLKDKRTPELFTRLSLLKDKRLNLKTPNTTQMKIKLNLTTMQTI